MSRRCGKGMWCAYLGLWLLYGWVAWTSLGYDDEFFNIALIEQYGFGALAIVQQVDVHPPGGYVLNWLFFSALGDWSAVRLLSGLLTASALVYVIEVTRQRHGLRAGLLAWVLLGLNPAFLLWCTGLRWYAYFVPVLLCLLITPRVGGWRYWAKCFAGLWLLGHLGYAVLLLAPAVLWLYWRACPDALPLRRRQAAWVGVLAGLAYFPQGFVFLTIHAKSGDAQVSALTKSLLGFAVAQFGNQGVFPLSIGGVASALGTLGFLLLALWGRPLLRAQSYALPYGLTALLLVLSGLAGKFRNLVVLDPLQGLWMATADVVSARRGWASACLALVALGHGIGVVNVVTHQGTTKNSWNLPVPAVLAALAEMRAQCGGPVLVAVHDPVLTRVLRDQAYAVLGPYATGASLAVKPRCLVSVRTFAGSLPDAELAAMDAQLADSGLSIQAEIRLGRDPDFAFKQYLDPRYPEYQVTLVRHAGVPDVARLSAWRAKPVLP